MGLVNQNIVDKLQQAKSKMYNNRDIMQEIVQHKDSVLSRYGKLFNKDNIKYLTKEEFQGFLHFKNNHHRTGFYRSQTKICEDMIQLQNALKLLQIEDLEIVERFYKINSMVRGMGHGIISALLFITNPDNCGVWNRPSEGGLKQLGIWPKFERGVSLGNKYYIINEMLKELATSVDVNLWTLDAIWWAIKPTKSIKFEDIGAVEEIESDSELPSSYAFGFEKYLHEFIVDNSELTDLSKEWNIYNEDGDGKKGYKYQCDAGEIDILAKHKSENRSLEIELKRNQSSDATIGQILRIMGSVRMWIAESDYEVEGLIIAKEMDNKLKYAISEVSRVKFKGYKVSFSLD